VKKVFLCILVAAVIAAAAGYGKKASTPNTLVMKPGMISDFENKKVWDISPETGFTLKLSTEHVTEGKHSLRVVYPIGGYPSINTRKLAHEWGKYDALCFDIFNPQDKAISFTVRLDDEKKRRVNIPVSLEPGMNNITIPRQRISGSIDAANIYKVVLFLNGPREKTELYFDNMRLANQQSDVKDDISKGRSAGARANSGRRVAPIEVKEIFEQKTIMRAFPATGAIKTYIVNLTTPKKTDVLVSTGIPFAPGMIFDDKNVAIFDLQGQEFSIASKVLARWPHDGSVRSVLVQFPMKIEHKYKQVYVKWGPRRTTKELSLTKVDWILPEGLLLLPPIWLCDSRIAGEQVLMGDIEYRKYDQNIENYFPRVENIKWTNNVGKDGYYDTPHVFYQFYVRSGNDEYFKAARRELVHYRDDQIIQEGPNRGSAIASKKTRYIYVEALVDDYLLTGDEKSLLVAGYMAEYLKKNVDPKKAYVRRGDSHFWTEREMAFPFLGVVEYYELTGDKEYLNFASEMMKNLYRTQKEWPDRGGFIHNLYSHDTEEGARRDEYGGSPFMTGLLLEAIVKYHQITNSNIAKESIFMALDWLTNNCLAPSGDSFVYLTCDKHRGEGHPDLNMLIVHAFGYGYKISGYSRKDYLELGQTLFERGVNSARLSDRKHFNQNYRSSGHFLAYIAKPPVKGLLRPPEVTPSEVEGAASQ